MWTRRPPTYVKEDARPTGQRYKPKINAGGLHLPSMMSIFLVLLPPKWVDDILKYTNAHFDDSDAVNKKLDKGELLRFMGYMILLTLQDYLPLDKMWAKQSPAGTSAPPPQFGRFGMSQNRFFTIKSRLRFGPEDNDSLEANEWCFVEGLVDAFNEHTKEVIIPGWLLATDESMFAWRGKVGKRDRMKCPHRMFVRRKPEPLGVELKNTADALMGVILFMEIVKGKAEVVKPKFYDKQRNPATAATTMRLAENWFGTGRVVAGDSWFASVRTCEQMLLNGLHFIGDVKTASSRYPTDDIFADTAAENGSWATMTSTLEIHGDEKPIFACTHRRGESIHGFVGTCGTSLPGKALNVYFEDDEERAMGDIAEHEITRKAASIHNDFTLAQPAIDRHNRYRQAILAMEKRFVTNNFSFRFFTSMLGTLIVNVFMAHKYLNDPLADFRTELDKLGIALVNNVFINACPSPAAGISPPKACTAKSPPNSECVDHHLVSLRSIVGENVWKKGMQRRCVICNADTVWACMECTTDAHAVVSLCPEVSVPRKGQKKGIPQHHACLSKHRLRPDWMPKGMRCCGTKRAGPRGGTGDAGSDPEVGDDSDEE